MIKCTACELPSDTIRQGICPKCAAELEAFLALEAEDYEDMIRDLEMTIDNECR